MPISTPRWKAWWTPSGSTRGRCAARVRACWCRSAWPKRFTPRSARAWRRCAWDRRWIRRSTLARLFRRCSWSDHEDGGRQGVAEGAKCWQPSHAMPEKGCFYPPTLLTDVHPAATVVQEEIFGPVLVAMTFRTPAEAAELANNTVYGLAASVWSENINVALDLASQVKAGVVWVNCDQPVRRGLRVWRLSRIGLRARRRPRRHVRIPDAEVAARRQGQKPRSLRRPVQRAMGRRLRHRQLQLIARSSSTSAASRRGRTRGYSYPVYGRDGKLLGEAPLGNRKDIRNAVEAARQRVNGRRQSAHNRAQVLYYIAENLIQRATRLAPSWLCWWAKIRQALKSTNDERIFAYAGWADKFEGAVHNPPARNVTLAMNEAGGHDRYSRSGGVAAAGLCSRWCCRRLRWATPWSRFPASVAATVMATSTHLDTSDLPGGVVNIVAGRAARDRQDARRPRRHRRRLVLPR